MGGPWPGSPRPPGRRSAGWRHAGGFKGCRTERRYSEAGRCGRPPPRTQPLAPPRPRGESSWRGSCGRTQADSSAPVATGNGVLSRGGYRCSNRCRPGLLDPPLRDLRRFCRLLRFAGLIPSFLAFRASQYFLVSPRAAARQAGVQRSELSGRYSFSGRHITKGQLEVSF